MTMCELMHNSEIKSVGFSGPDLGLVGPQAIDIVGPQPPHTITAPYNQGAPHCQLWGPLSPGAPKHSFFCFYVNSPLRLLYVGWLSKGTWRHELYTAAYSKVKIYY